MAYIQKLVLYKLMHFFHRFQFEIYRYIYKHTNVFYFKYPYKLNLKTYGTDH